MWRHVFSFTRTSRKMKLVFLNETTLFLNVINNKIKTKRDSKLKYKPLFPVNPPHPPTPFVREEGGWQSKEKTKLDWLGEGASCQRGRGLRRLEAGGKEMFRF